MKRKLTLNRETVRILQDSQLRDVDGGAPSALCTKYFTCTSVLTCGANC